MVVKEGTPDGCLVAWLLGWLGNDDDNDGTGLDAEGGKGDGWIQHMGLLDF